MYVKTSCHRFGPEFPRKVSLLDRQAHTGLRLVEARTSLQESQIIALI